MCVKKVELLMFLFNDNNYYIFNEYDFELILELLSN